VGVEMGKDSASDGLQALADKFRNESGGRIVAGTLPVHVAFPEFGPSVFLAAELTAEAQAPAVELLVRRVNQYASEDCPMRSTTSTTWTMTLSIALPLTAAGVAGTPPPPH